MNDFRTFSARLRLAAPDMTVRKADSEYRITFTLEAIARAFPDMTRPQQIAKAEALACYEADRDSAYDSAVAMQAVGLIAPPAPVLTIKPRMGRFDVWQGEAVANGGTAWGFDTEESARAWIAEYLTGFAPATAEAPLGPVTEAEKAARDSAPFAEAEAAPARKVETISIAMNWKAAAGIIRAALENGTGEGRRAAAEELARMADLADARNDLARAVVTLRAACQAVLDEFPAADGRRIESVKAACRNALAETA